MLIAEATCNTAVNMGQHYAWGFVFCLNIVQYFNYNCTPHSV